MPNTASDHQHALMLTNAQCEMIVAALRAHAQGSLEQARAYVDRAIASYDGDPADNQFQRGFLAALEVVRDEAFAPTSTDGNTGG